MMRIKLESAPQGSGDGIGWQLSGFRKVAHFIIEDGDDLKTRCGVTWMMSDAVTTNPANDITPKCKRCSRREANNG